MHARAISNEQKIRQDETVWASGKVTRSLLPAVWGAEAHSTSRVALTAIFSLWKAVSHSSAFFTSHMGVYRREVVSLVLQ